MARLDQHKLFDYHTGRFHGGNMVFSAAGNLDHDQFVEAVSQKFSAARRREPRHRNARARSPARASSCATKRRSSRSRSASAFPRPPITDENRYATLILNTVLGGGMSSRLFQTIREERGMAYSVFSDLSPYRDTGTLCVYAGTSAGKALEIIDLILTEFRNLKEELLLGRRTDPRQGPAQGQHPHGP